MWIIVNFGSVNVGWKRLMWRCERRFNIKVLHNTDTSQVDNVKKKAKEIGTREKKTHTLRRRVFIYVNFMSRSVFRTFTEKFDNIHVLFRLSINSIIKFTKINFNWMNWFTKWIHSDIYKYTYIYCLLRLTVRDDVLWIIDWFIYRLSSLYVFFSFLNQLFHRKTEKLHN